MNGFDSVTMIAAIKTEEGMSFIKLMSSEIEDIKKRYTDKVLFIMSAKTFSDCLYELLI